MVHFVKEFVDEDYSDAEKIVFVMDNLESIQRQMEKEREHMSQKELSLKEANGISH